MTMLKSVWITEHNANMVAISMESAQAEPEHMRILVRQDIFPHRTLGYPRHVTVLSLFETDDLLKIYEAIHVVLCKRGVLDGD